MVGAMIFPADFIKKVELEYPEEHALLRCLREGHSPAAGWELYRLAGSAEESISPKVILSAFNEGRKDFVRELAETAVRRRDLHEEWKKLDSKIFKVECPVCHNRIKRNLDGTVSHHGLDLGWAGIKECKGTGQQSVG